MSDLDHEAAEEYAAPIAKHFGRHGGPTEPDHLVNLARCYLVRGERIAELEGLFQQHHGVHVSWVAVDARHRERIARLEALVREHARCHWCCGSGKHHGASRPDAATCDDCAGTGLIEAAREELKDG